MLKRIWKGKGETWKWKEYIRRYMMNNTMTRDFLSRHPRCTGDREAWCPTCAAAGVGEIRQTKEHLYGGKCVVTRDIREGADKKIEELMKGWGLEVRERREMREVWEREERKVEMNGDVLERHTGSPALIGIWKNITVLRMRQYLVEKKGWRETQAMEGVMELAEERMRMGREIARQVAKLKEALLTLPSEAELRGFEERGGGEREVEGKKEEIRRRAGKLEGRKTKMWRGKTQVDKEVNKKALGIGQRRAEVWGEGKEGREGEKEIVRGDGRAGAEQRREGREEGWHRSTLRRRLGELKERAKGDGSAGGKERQEGREEVCHRSTLRRRLGERERGRGEGREGKGRGQGGWKGGCHQGRRGDPVPFDPPRLPVPFTHKGNATEGKSAGCRISSQMVGRRHK